MTESIEIFREDSPRGGKKISDPANVDVKTMKKNSSNACELLDKCYIFQTGLILY